MATSTLTKAQSGALSVTARPYVYDVTDGTNPGVRKWFQSWSGASTPLPGGQSANGTLASYPAVRSVTDAAITSGAATLTSATAAFAAADVGSAITVAGAGAAGATLTTTILSVTNATTAVLSANAGTTVTGANSTIGFTTITLTANYGLGQTLTLTQPANGTIAADTPIPSDAAGYQPGTVVSITYTPPSGATLYQVASWTGATVNPADPNNATYTTDYTNTAHTVSVTTSSPSSRVATVTTPLTGAVTLS